VSVHRIQLREPEPSPHEACGGAGPVRPPTLTLVVSLEAIFLSTFVMISQNRADEKRQVVAAEEWRLVGKEAAVRRTLESSPRASDHGGTTPHDSLRDREVLPGGSF
jgi:hypothetical protein